MPHFSGDDGPNLSRGTLVMKKIYLFFLVVLISTHTLAQEVVQVDKPDLSDTYLNAMNQIYACPQEDMKDLIPMLEQAFSRVTMPYERCLLIFWGLSVAYAEAGELEKCFDILKQGFDEGLYFTLRTGDRPWPSYVPALQKLSGFEDFLKKNNARRDEEQKTALSEYIIQLPDGYDDTLSYPLLVVLHGGVGSHVGSTEFWYSPKLQSDYIVAYLQGIQCVGSFRRGFLRNDFTNILNIIEHINERYPVDQSRIVLGGPSAGGGRALRLALNDLVHAKGLLLGFSGIPRDMSDSQIQTMKDRGVRIALLTGEHDGRVDWQIDAVARFNKHEIPTRFLIFSGKGHEYPDHFTKEIDLSLDFIFKE